MTQQFHARCGGCGATWKLAEPDGVRMTVEAAIEAMNHGICPVCANDGAAAPIRWKVAFKAHPPKASPSKASRNMEAAD